MQKVTMDNVDIGGLYICNRKVLLVPGFLDVSDYWKNEYDVKYLKIYSVIFSPLELFVLMQALY